MKNPAKSYRGTYRADDGSVIDVHAAIGKPRRNKGQKDWSCTVHCPFLFEADKKIVGADANQALELAESFIRDLLEHHGVEIEEI